MQSKDLKVGEEYAYVSYPTPGVTLGQHTAFRVKLLEKDLVNPNSWEKRKGHCKIESLGEYWNSRSPAPAPSGPGAPGLYSPQASRNLVSTWKDYVAARKPYVDKKIQELEVRQQESLRRNEILKRVQERMTALGFTEDQVPVSFYSDGNVFVSLDILAQLVDAPAVVSTSCVECGAHVIDDYLCEKCRDKETS